MLTPLAENIWTVAGPLKLGGIALGCRSTIVALKEGGLWIHSPIAFSPEQAEAIRTLGEVRFLVAPNLFHHFFLKSALKQFPGAKLFGPVGLPEKKRDLVLDGTFEDTPLPWQGDIESFSLKGQPKFRETVFFHRGSGTLIVADLIFNLQKFPNWRSKLAARLFGTRDGFAVSRLLKTMIKDRAQFTHSLAPVLGLPIERISPAHGEIATATGKELKHAFERRGLAPT